MVILSRLADYAVIIATHLAEVAPAQVNAAHLAADTRLPPATVAKVLKLLARGGVVTALRGASGGYRLARGPGEVSVADIVAAIDGTPSMTHCGVAESACERRQFCPTRPHWQRINQAVEQALGSVTLADMAAPLAVPPPMAGFTGFERAAS